MITGDAGRRDTAMQGTSAVDGVQAAGSRSIHQLMPSISYGDAIGNHALHLHAMFRSWGFESAIFAENIDPRLTSVCTHSSMFRSRGRPSDVLLLHYSTYCRELAMFREARAKKILVYHNVTPARFFLDYDLKHYYLASLGRSHLRDAVSAADLLLGVSRFNCRDLERDGRDCRVLPMFIDFRSLNETPPDRRVLARYGDGRTNVLFVGRIAPNKKQDDVIAAFAAYRARYDPSSRLLLIGSYFGLERYRAELAARADALGVADSVVFPGHVDHSELIAFYRIANAFLSLSEHEGFGVPLIEAMHFDIPVIAYAAAAVPETLAGAGVLVDEKQPEALAALLHRVITDAAFRSAVLARQRVRLRDFDHAANAALLRTYLREVIDP